MGNTITTIKTYFGYQDEMLYVEHKENIDIETKQKMLEEQIISLQKQIDKDKDNRVSKDELLEYFDRLSSQIDKNTDGVITHNELEIYVNNQLKLSSNEIDKWKISYEKLKQEYEKLKQEYEILIDEHINNKNGLDNSKTTKSTISTLAIKEYIETEIIKSDANLKLIPDPLERKIYITIYKTIMKSLEKLFNTTHLDLLNHRISFSILPIPINDKNKSSIIKNT